jgi:O-antigen/teichoic acid export membrane protein
MDGRRSIGQNFRWMLLGSVAFAASQWLMLASAAKFGTAEDLGRLAAALALTTPLMLLFSFQLETAYVSDVSDEFRFREYLGLRLLSLPVFAGVSAGISALRGAELDTILVTLALVSLRSAKIVGDLYLGVPSRSEEMAGRGLSLCAKSAISVVVLGGGLAAGMSLSAALFLSAGLTLLVVVACDRPTAMRHNGDRRRVRLARIGALARRVAPHSLSASVWSVTMAVPAYIVEGTQGLKALGVFAVVTSMLNVGRTLNAALSTAAGPRLAVLYHQRSEQFWTLLLRLLGTIGGVNLTALAFFAMFGRPFLRYAFAPEFEQYHRELVLACGVNLAASVSGALGQVLGNMRWFTVELLVNVACLLLSFPVSVLAVRHWQLDGALVALACIAAARIAALAALLIVESRGFVAPTSSSTLPVARNEPARTLA